MERERPTGRGLRRAGMTLLVVVSFVATTVQADAARSTRTERDRVRRERAAAARELDVLEAQDSAVLAGLRSMNGQVAAQQQRLESAQQAVRASEAEAAAAAQAELAMQEQVADLRQSLRDIAVHEFMTGGRLRLDEISLESSDLSEQARRSVFADFVVGNATAINDQLRSLSEDLTLARERADAAAEAAHTRRAEVDARLAELSSARDEQAAFAAKLDERIESRLAESAALAAVDSRLSARLAAEQAALARANAGRRSTSRSFTAGRVRLRTVRGITVAESIADQLERLLAAASADGITFGGGGYRDPQQQQRLREAHCPDPYRSPASSCSPPTARPGHSMHERGLAIDFTVGGRTLTRSSAGYRWLQRHAASYGFYNLPSEAWHWSTNGN